MRRSVLHSPVPVPLTIAMIAGGIVLILYGVMPLQIVGALLFLSGLFGPLLLLSRDDDVSPSPDQRSETAIAITMRSEDQELEDPDSTTANPAVTSIVVNIDASDLAPAVAAAMVEMYERGMHREAFIARLSSNNGNS